jgi:hypothetical protein
MAALTYPTWLPTDLSNFAPTNCTLASSFYVQALTGNDAPMQKTLDVLKDSLQGYWMANNVSMPSSGEIAAFVVDALEAQDTSLAENITNSVGQFVGRNCLADYCEDLPWQGNADLSGRGVSRSITSSPLDILTLNRCLSATSFKLALQLST